MIGLTKKKPRVPRILGHNEFPDMKIMNEKMPDPSTVKSYAEYIELLEKKKEWVRKHGHRMLDEPGDWEYIPATQEDKGKST